jgi:hypothetical protein
MLFPYGKGKPAYEMPEVSARQSQYTNHFGKHEQLPVRASPNQARLFSCGGGSKKMDDATQGLGYEILELMIFFAEHLGKYA